jgi:hypothetical protein
MVNNLGIIIHKTDYKKKEENMTIYSIYKKNHPVTTKQILNVFDLGYLGVEKDFPKQLSSIPIRRERNLELFSKRIATKIILKKENNNREHTICGLKKYSILADIFRNKLKKYNNVSDIVLGLVNYRIMN